MKRQKREDVVEIPDGWDLGLSDDWGMDNIDWGMDNIDWGFGDNGLNRKRTAEEKTSTKKHGRSTVNPGSKQERSGKRFDEMERSSGYIARRDFMMRWIENKGYMLTEEATPLQEECAKYAMTTALSICPSALDKGFTGWYLYKQEQQADTVPDGISWIYVLPEDNKTRWFAVGLSLAALNRGTEYAAFLALHEFCHIFVKCPGDKHTKAFHKKLDEFIEKYNAKFGTNIVNDYI